MRALGQEYRQAEASTGGGDFQRLPAGGYVCRILKVKDHGDEQKPYLHFVYDIAEGDYAGYYSDDWGKENEWAHDMRQYYTPAAFGIFKGFLKSVDISNNTHFEDEAATGIDENRLIGKFIGLIIGEEEYESNQGEVKTKLRVRGVRPIQTIRDGKFKVPELKKLPLAEIDATIEPTPMDADDLPF